MKKGKKLYNSINDSKKLAEFIVYTNMCHYCVNWGKCNDINPKLTDCVDGVKAWLEEDCK